jgi:hypothetical protein
MNPPQEPVIRAVVLAAIRCLVGQEPGKPFLWYDAKTKEALAENGAKSVLYRLNWDDTRTTGPKGEISLFITTTPPRGVDQSWSVIKIYLERYGARVSEQSINGRYHARFRPPPMRTFLSQDKIHQRPRLESAEVVQLPDTPAS